MNAVSTIFLLHGLGANTLTLKPLELFLNAKGIRDTHCISYNVDTQTTDESVIQVSSIMERFVRDKHSAIILIGQSMGGVIANEIHKHGWDNIQMMITIGSPLHGARLLNTLESVLPSWIRDTLYKIPYDDLKNKERAEPPPHAYKTISMAWPFLEFDGCVYKDESCFEQRHHTHLSWADHRTIFMNPRLWIIVHRLIADNQ